MALDMWQCLQKNKMKICFLTTYFNENRGGSEVYANLFRSLKGTHQFTVMTARSIAAEPAWETVIVPTKTSHSYAWVSDRRFARNCIRALRQWHMREHFDLIIVNQVIARNLVGLKEFGIPVLYVIHHPVSADIALAQEETPSFLERLKWRLRYWGMWRTQQYLTKAFDHLLTVSESSQQRIAADYGIPPEKIHVIYNGIDVDFFHKTQPTQSKTILTLGSYHHPRRGFRYLREIYARLAARGYRIIDVGRRSDEQDAQMANIPNVASLGLVEKSRLPDLYSQASVVVSTALFEGFGLTIAEALACQTPIVAFAAGGVIDVLQRVDPWLLCPLRDVDQLIEKVEALASDAHPFDGTKAREAIVTHFSRTQMAQHYERLFRSLVSK